MAFEVDGTIPTTIVLLRVFVVGVWGHGRGMFVLDWEEGTLRIKA